MARSFTPEELLARLRENCDIENDQHLSDTELYKILSSAVAETWDRIISAGLHEQYVKNVSFAVTSGTQEYSLATICTDGDFYKIHQLFVNEGDGRLRPIVRINSAEQYGYKPPQQSCTMKLYYIPCAPELEADGASFDGINGFEEHTLALAEITVRKKRMEDYSGAARRKQEMEQRIASMGNTDWAEPPRVVRRRARAADPFWVYKADVNAYILRGNKLELVYYYGLTL